MAIFRDIRRCSRKTANTSSISNSNCIIINNSNKVTSWMCEGINRRVPSSPNPSLIRRITKTMITTWTSRMMATRSWRWMMRMRIQMDRVKRAISLAPAAPTESAKSASEEFYSPKRKPLSLNDDSASSDTCQHRNANISHRSSA